MLRVPVNRKVKKLFILLQALPSLLDLVCSCTGPSGPRAPASSSDTHQVRLPGSLSPPSALQATWLSLFLLSTSPASERPFSPTGLCGAPIAWAQRGGRPTLVSLGTICFLQLPPLRWALRAAQHPFTYLILTPHTNPTVAISNTDSLQVLTTSTYQPTALLDPWLSPISLPPPQKRTQSYSISSVTLTSVEESRVTHRLFLSPLLSSWFSYLFL